MGKCNMAARGGVYLWKYRERKKWREGGVSKELELVVVVQRESVQILDCRFRPHSGPESFLTTIGMTDEFR